MNVISHDSKHQQVMTVCGFIHHNFDGVEKVFLPKRAETKKFLPGVYELPGGHVEFGEEATVALKRELVEELGMNVQVGDILCMFSYVNNIKRSQTFEVVYFAQFTGPVDSIQLHIEDHSEYGWFAESELVNATTPRKGIEDDEFIAMQKGFALLRGESLKF